ncbi:MAG: methionyl-tRNA formyltransferase, partial [Gammaproteobacteria bacterium]
RVWGAGASATGHDKEPGTILHGACAGLVVACGEGTLSLTRIQLPGRRPVPVADFLNAHDLPPGQRLGG